MALTHADLAVLMFDQAFCDRIMTAVMLYADQIRTDAAANPTPSAPPKLRWAESVFAAPDAIADQVQPVVVIEDMVRQQGAAISDANLDTCVQNAVNKKWNFR